MEQAQQLVKVLPKFIHARKLVLNGHEHFGEAEAIALAPARVLMPELRELDVTNTGCSKDKWIQHLAASGNAEESVARGDPVAVHSCASVPMAWLNGATSKVVDVDGEMRDGHGGLDAETLRDSAEARSCD